MTNWTVFPHLGEYAFDATRVKKHWAKLHAGDAEPLPTNEKLLEAWALFHSGEFQKAAELGMALANAGVIAGLTVANKATCIYANYLEANESAKLALFMDVAKRAEKQALDAALSAESLPNAYYWQAYALGPAWQRLWRRVWVKKSNMRWKKPLNCSRNMLMPTLRWARFMQK